MTTKLYVGNLSFRTSDDDLKELFKLAGTVESASVVEDREAARSRGFGFIELGKIEEGRERISRPANKPTEVALTLTEDEEANEQVKRYFTEIADSRKRVRKTQTQINRLKKKTQAIIDKLS